MSEFKLLAPLPIEIPTDFIENDVQEHSVEAKCSVNIKSKKDRYELLVVAPGFRKKDFKIKVENGLLNITATASDVENNELDFQCQHFFNSSFSASFKLPLDVSVAHVYGAYSGGIFMITLLKSMHIPEKKKIKSHLVVKEYQYGQYFYR